ncbi:MAG: hypothetical protein R2788_25375 [Saprospiraceae bacterium]
MRLQIHEKSSWSCVRKLETLAVGLWVQNGREAHWSTAWRKPTGDPRLAQDQLITF